MSHTNEIDTMLGHSQDNVNFSVTGNENVLLLGFGILLTLLVIVLFFSIVLFCMFILFVLILIFIIQL